MNRELWQKCLEFHGHECPGIAIGFKACEAAMDKMSLGFSQDEEIVCVTENDACGVDAIQVITGCTFGKGNLVFRDVGKMAFTFFKRDTGQALRMVLKPILGEMSREERMQFILAADVDDLFSYTLPLGTVPDKAKSLVTVICASCGEGVAETKTKSHLGQLVCLDCQERLHI